MDNGEWICGSLLEDEVKQPTLCFIFDGIEELNRPWNEVAVAPDTVGQFTGLCDCKDKEIYEGDIVNIPAYGMCEVLASPYGWGWRTKDGMKYRDGSCVYRSVDSTRFIFGQCTVVGNIHDNPELMKGGK